MDLYKIGVKIFVTQPEAVNLRDFIPVFHRWIQQQVIPGHLLIDVHDYSHVPNGPGILLVAPEGNFCLDRVDSRLGLQYYRKRPLDGDFAVRLQNVIEVARQAVRLLENDPQLRGIRFHPDELVVFSNDRLLAPNTAEALGPLQSLVSQALGPQATVTHDSPDPRERLAIRVINP